MQSTLGAELAAMLGVPLLALDTFFWQPGWGKTPPDEFRTSVRAALDACPGGWVVDGSYDRRLGDMVTAEATDVICKASSPFSAPPRYALRVVRGADVSRSAGVTSLCAR